MELVALFICDRLWQQVYAQISFSEKTLNLYIFPSDKIPEKSPASDDEPYSLTDVLPAELLPWEREILLLRYSAGLFFAEIAQRLHIKESSCRSRHLRAKAHLKSLMQD